MDELKSRQHVDPTVTQSGAFEFSQMASNATPLVFRNDVLHVRNRPRQLDLYIPTSILDEIFRMAHSAAHQPADKMYATSKSRFW